MTPTTISENQTRATSRTEARGNNFGTAALPSSFLPESVECWPDMYTPAQYQSRMPKIGETRSNRLLVEKPAPSGWSSSPIGGLLVLGGIVVSAAGHPYVGLPMLALGIAACGDDEVKGLPKTENVADAGTANVETADAGTQSDAGTTPAVNPNDFCVNQTCLTSTSYYCKLSGGTGMTMDCPKDMVCSDGACSTPPAQLDLNCPAGKRTQCEVTDVFDIGEEADHGLLRGSGAFADKLSTYQWGSGVSSEWLSAYQCGSDQAHLLYGIYRYGAPDQPAWAKYNWASWNMKVIPPPYASSYILDRKMDWFFSTSADRGQGNPPPDVSHNPTLIIQFGDEQRRTIPLSDEWEHCVLKKFGDFNTNGVEAGKAQIQVSNGGQQYCSSYSIFNFLPEHDGGQICSSVALSASSILALAKARVWSCGCK